MEAIVSSAHLAAGAAPELSEVEFGLTLAMHAYQRWLTRCMEAAGQKLSTIEVLILHTVLHRNRPKRLADILLVLDIEEPHVAAYAVGKLEAAGLVATRRAGKEKLVAVTTAGAALCARYAAVREQVLAGAVATGGPAPATLSGAGAVLRALGGFYNQASRSAATM